MCVRLLFALLLAASATTVVRFDSGTTLRETASGEDFDSRSTTGVGGLTESHRRSSVLTSNSESESEEDANRQLMGELRIVNHREDEEPKYFDQLTKPRLRDEATEFLDSLTEKQQGLKLFRSMPQSEILVSEGKRWRIDLQGIVKPCPTDEDECYNFQLQWNEKGDRNGRGTTAATLLVPKSLQETMDRIGSSAVQEMLEAMKHGLARSFEEAMTSQEKDGRGIVPTLRIEGTFTQAPQQQNPQNPTSTRAKGGGKKLSGKAQKRKDKRGGK